MGLTVLLDMNLLFGVVAFLFPGRNAQQCVSFKICHEMCDSVLVHDCSVIFYAEVQKQPRPDVHVCTCLGQDEATDDAAFLVSFSPVLLVMVQFS